MLMVDDKTFLSTNYLISSHMLNIQQCFLPIYYTFKSRCKNKVISNLEF